MGSVSITYPREHLHNLVDSIYDQVDDLKKPPTRRPISTLRRVRQADIAVRMGRSQPGVSWLERQSVVDEKTLRSYIEACGATLELVARTPEGQLVRLDIRISN